MLFDYPALLQIIVIAPTVRSATYELPNTGTRRRTMQLPRRPPLGRAAVYPCAFDHPQYGCGTSVV